MIFQKRFDVNHKKVNMVDSVETGPGESEDCRTGNDMTADSIVLNLDLDGFITAVENQARPLVIPLCAEIALPTTSPEALFLSMRKGPGFLLESMDGGEKIARYSFIGIDPKLILSIGKTIKLEGDPLFIGISKNPVGSNAIDQVRSILRRFHFVNLKAPRFFGGMVGYFSYDMISSLHPTAGDNKEHDERKPLARFLLAKDGIVLDHRDRRCYVFESPLLMHGSDPVEAYQESRNGICRMISEIERAENAGKTSGVPPAVTHVPYTSSVAKDEFEKAVQKTKEYIRAGDILQSVISRKISCPFDGDPFRIYRALRQINPSPYMYFLDFGDQWIIGSSPEMLIRVENGRVTTVPIAGTRPRGKDCQEDEALSADLLSDEKERAEHVMLVDLARNDLGRVCKFGTVSVPDFMGIERFSHVQHIVSTVTGTLRDHLDPCDALAAAFPAGTVSGAPKVRAMQIIGELEHESRGVYAGAVGWIGFNRNLEFAIAIRTVVAERGMAEVQVGAGIVADSVPETEWVETEAKARGMCAAIEVAGGV